MHSDPSSSSPRRLVTAAQGALLAVTLSSLALTAHTHAQDAAPAPASAALPDANAPLADPVVNANAVFSADRATVWQEGDARFIHLDGDALFELSSYGFRADRAVIRIDRQSLPGQEISHLSIYLDGARSMHGRGSVTAEAPRLLVTASTRGQVELVTDVLHTGRPSDRLVADAEARFQRHREALAKALLDGPTEPVFPPGVEAVREARRAQIAQQQLAQQVEQLPGVTTPLPPRPRQARTAQPPSEREAGRPPVTSADAERDVAQMDEERGQPVAVREDVVQAQRTTVLPTRGAVYIAADSVVGSMQDNALMLIGDVNVVYQDRQSGRDVALTAERVVVFGRGDVQGAVASQEMDASNVEGVYLEENVVVTDGRFTVRAPRMYFDLEQNKAVLLDAVMYTWDERRNIPLYLRAETIRQTSATSFEAENALLTTSEFAEPHVAIGADRVTITRTPDGGGEGDGNGSGGVDRFKSVGNTVRWGGVPVFYWPYLAGSNRDTPLREVNVEHSSQNGTQVETTWDLFALAGQERPDGVDLLGQIDYLGNHGPGLGLNLTYERPEMFGGLDAYTTPIDSGTDELANRRDIEHDEEFRGLVHWQHRHYLENDLELSLEASYISDETFLEEFFSDEAFQAREYETSAFLKKQEDDWSLSLLTKYNLNDFVPQLTTLQTPGYTVDKLPELAYHRIGTSLWDDRLTYFTENRAGWNRIRFGEDAPEDRGFTPRQSAEIFGIAPDVEFQDFAEAVGYPSDYVGRIDTRHEINAPLQLGIIDATPYVTGRITGYDRDFDDYSGEDDQVRLWGQVGTRFHTQFVRSYDGFESDLLDVHRVRHVVEPNLDLFGAATTLENEDLPVFDNDVENIDDGAGVRIGMTNTFQTQRGGAPGDNRWRSVDWVRLKTDFVFRENDDDPYLLTGGDGSDLARFFDYRPEFSTGGDHFYTELLWAVSDTFGVTGELTHDLEEDQVAQWRIGATLQHTPRLSSFVDYEEIDIIDLRLLSYGFDYQLTTKYRIGLAHKLDFSARESRKIRFSLERRLPRWRLRFIGDYDEIDSESTFGLVLIPEGFDSITPRVPLNNLITPF